MAATMRAADLIDSIGINVHLEFTNSDYGDAAEALADLRYLGITHVRDAANWSALRGLSGYDVFADAGIKFDLVAVANRDPADLVGLIEDFARRHPGAVAAIEGPNEINNWPVSYQGQTGAAGAIAYVDDLVGAISSSVLLRDVDTFDLTGAFVDDDAAFGNYHPYPKNGDQPLANLSRGLARVQAAAPGREVVITEAGYHTGMGNEDWEGVDERTQAKLTLNLLLDATRLGVDKIYLYQLFDAYPDTSGIMVDRHLGLFDIDGRPKQAAVALHNLTSILYDDAATANGFITWDLAFTLVNMPATGASLVVEKASGAHDIILWAEPDIWDEANDRAINVAAADSVVRFDGRHVDVRLFDPLISDQPIAIYSDVTSVHVALSDHPIIVEVSDAAGPAIISGGAGNDVLRGGADDEVIQGGGGNDRLIGGGGPDILTGGAGADVFVYPSIGSSSASAAGRDQITDFSHAEGDRIDLKGIDANVLLRGNQAFSLGGASFDNRPGELIQTVSGDGYLVQGDLNGDGRADFSLLVLHQEQPLVAADFIL